MSEALSHSERHLTSPTGWVLYVSHRKPMRLVVFVHGFGGRAVGSWQQFPESGQTRAWWRESDMLFVGYDSRRDNISAAASRLRRELPTFYPHLPNEVLEAGDALARPASEEPYQELYLAGHSLGGVVVRRALCDSAYRWLELQDENPGGADIPALLDARVRLFSPASAGFRPAGLLGLIRSSPLWVLANMSLHRSSAYSDLQRDSPFLAETRQRTERLVNDFTEFAALRARILWANPDNVVLPERYDSDYVDDAIDGTTHATVCKPNEAYEAPWSFVEIGEVV